MEVSTFLRKLPLSRPTPKGNDNDSEENPLDIGQAGSGVVIDNQNPKKLSAVGNRS